MTIVGLDIGNKRVGIAYENRGIIFPFKVIIRATLVSELKKLIKEKQVTKIVIGMPYGEYSENTQLWRIEKTFLMLQNTFPEIEFFKEDERFTTLLSSNFLLENGQDTSQKKDDLSASYILESYLQRIKI